MVYFCHGWAVKIDLELGALAQQQGGYLGREQVEALGLSSAGIKWRLTSGNWVSVQRGIYHVAGISGTHRELVRAAGAILPNATVSHQSAAELHGLRYVPRGLAVVTVHARTTHGFPGVQVHRSLDLTANHRMRLDGMWTTTVARTLVDNAAVLHSKAMGLMLDDALASGRTKIGDVAEVFRETARRGRTGSALMRGLLDERIGDELVAATQIEKLGMKVFVDGGLPHPVFQYPAPWNPEHRIDFAWPYYCVGCEADSRRWHTRLDQFQNDRERDNLALIHRWRILRFTWQDFTQRPGRVVAVVRSALASAS